MCSFPTAFRSQSKPTAATIVTKSTASQRTRPWMARETARRQAAQAGYACDYQNKRLPLALNEIKQWQQGQQQLEKELEGKPAGCAGARIGKRLMSDCYARGVVRGSVETCNSSSTTRSASSGAQNPPSADCLSCEGVGEHVFPLLLSSVLGGRSV